MECCQKVTVVDVAEKLKKNTERTVGEVMTIMESSLNGDSLVAMKRLVKQVLWRNYNNFIQKDLINEGTGPKEE